MFIHLCIFIYLYNIYSLYQLTIFIFFNWQGKKNSYKNNYYNSSLFFFLGRGNTSRYFVFWGVLKCLNLPWLSSKYIATVDNVIFHCMWLFDKAIMFYQQRETLIYFAWDIIIINYDLSQIKTTLTNRIRFDVLRTKWTWMRFQCNILSFLYYRHKRGRIMSMVFTRDSGCPITWW